MAQSKNIEAIWFFGYPGFSINFQNMNVENGGIPAPNNQLYNWNSNGVAGSSLAITDNNRNLLFFTQLRYHNHSFLPLNYAYPEMSKIFDKNGNSFPNGDIQIYNNNGGSGKPHIVPFPKDETKYYLFYVLNSGIFYSIVDMTLNNGLGDIDTTFKDQQLTSFGSIVGVKMTTIQSCDGIWLVVRSRTSRAYYSFKIDKNGLNNDPVISKIGNSIVDTYLEIQGFHGGVLKVSNNGLQLAAATNKGIELYDFEPCSGKLKNARIIDTMSAYGLCFSPDDSRLYASRNIKFSGLNQGEVYQYDLNSNDTSIILNSKNLIMRNTIYEMETILGPVRYTGPFGEMKIGLDGKIYVSKNNYIGRHEGRTLPCWVFYNSINDPIPDPVTQDCNFGQYMHVIHKPNQLGIACHAELNYLKLNDLSLIPGLLLQSDIKTPPSSPPDTTEGYVYHINVCFETKKELFAEENGACYFWDDGSTERNRIVDSSGIYWLSYFKDCTFQTDTFKVNFISLPEVPAVVYGCPSDIQLNIKLADQNTTAYLFTLENSILDFREIMQTYQDITFTKLEGGEYSLRIQTPNGCDTTLFIQLEAYPLPEIMVSPKDTLIYYGDAIELLARGASFYHWWPSGPLDSATTSSPFAMPLEPTEFTVLGINAYGCRDSTSLFVDINYDMPDFLPNAFSPNGDGLNDVFIIEGLKHQTLVQFRIFNRLGQEIFFSSNPNHGWDGNFQGKPCDVGVYYYIVEIANPNGKNKIFKGEVTLIR